MDNNAIILAGSFLDPINCHNSLGIEKKFWFKIILVRCFSKKENDKEFECLYLHYLVFFYVSSRVCSVLVNHNFVSHFTYADLHIIILLLEHRQLEVRLELFISVKQKNKTIIRSDSYWVPNSGIFLSCKDLATWFIHGKNCSQICSAFIHYLPTDSQGSPFFGSPLHFR